MTGNKGLFCLVQFRKGLSSTRYYSWTSPVSFIFNDIVEAINSSIRLFADNTSLFIIADYSIQAAEQLKEYVHKGAILPPSRAKNYKLLFINFF